MKRFWGCRNRRVEAAIQPVCAGAESKNPVNPYDFYVFLHRDRESGEQLCFHEKFYRKRRGFVGDPEVDIGQEMIDNSKEIVVR